MTTKVDWRAKFTTVEGLRRRYSHVHPLIFMRTVERADSAGEAFDIFEGMPSTFPLVWDDQKRSWIEPADMWLESGVK